MNPAPAPSGKFPYSKDYRAMIGHLLFWRRAIAVDAAAILARAAAGLRTIRGRHKARTAARRWTLNDHHLRDLGVHRGHVAARRLNIAWVGERDAYY